MGTFPLQMDFMATRMPPLCCIPLSKTPMKNNNRPTAPMAGPVGPAVKPIHFSKARVHAEPETGHARDMEKTSEKRSFTPYAAGCGQLRWP